VLGANVLDRFRDEMLGKLGEEIDAAAGREALVLISALGPLSMENACAIERMSTDLHRACVDRQGQPTGRAEVLLPRYGEVAIIPVLGNLAELDATRWPSCRNRLCGAPSPQPSGPWRRR
jgi:hypothetical protein